MRPLNDSWKKSYLAFDQRCGKPLLFWMALQGRFQFVYEHFQSLQLLVINGLIPIGIANAHMFSICKRWALSLEK